MEELQKNNLNTMGLEKNDPLQSTGPQISVSEFSCHCCYDILVNPTTLNCGQSFCQHCLAVWWVTLKKTECPECREKWEGFPKVNILLRDAIENLFPDSIRMRFEDIQQNNDIVQSLAAFQKYGNDLIPVVSNTGQMNQLREGGFFSGVLTALTGVAVVLLMYQWSSRESEHDLLVQKAVAKRTQEEVVLWWEQMGPWASIYRDRFLSERENGRARSLHGGITNAREGSTQAFLSACPELRQKRKGQIELKSCQQSNIKKWSLTLHYTVFGEGSSLSATINA
ncbi:PREDICTED: bifunctional apoptosis regulator-like [Galeopterus variegatus]|uniref:Bifunctional apoptosis regulator-like n=1 Tax=Galeopterus variegatus TaxID=482537 RepID=A0ABM0QBF1_GALVR|nr:PREDICTED: bifunctional apoptosis regulator-like [Galeopterus variegatus]